MLERSAQPRIAILGSWPEGLHEDHTVYPGQWEAWFRGNSSPRAVWQMAEPALRIVISRFGYLNVYVYYGDNAPVEYVAHFDQFVVTPQPEIAPGTVVGPDDPHHIWVRYREVRRLRRSIARDQLRELPIVGGQISIVPQAISEAGWHLMYRTGLIFVEDPGAGDLV